jgi:Tfp pilus assembly protein PilN
MRAVNLLPAERRNVAAASPFTPLARRPVFAVAGGIAVAAALATGFATHSASSSVAAKRRDLTQVRRQIATAKAQVRVVSASALASASSRRATILALAGPRLSWDAFLGSISRVLPEDVWLVGLTANPSGAAIATPTTSTPSSTTTTTTADTPFAISGYAYSQAAVARLMDRLELVPWLSGVELQSTTLTPLGNRSVFQFSIGASMANTGGAS